MSSQSPKQTKFPFVWVWSPIESIEITSHYLWELGATGIEERDENTLLKSNVPSQVLLVASFEDEQTANNAIQALPPELKSELRWVIGDGWKDEWKKYFHTLRIGPRLWVRPPWEESKIGLGETEVVLDPGRAFGSGTHETTKLVLRELDRRIFGGETILDVGCGSGILSIAALKLGAKKAVATEVDVDAHHVAIENAQINGVEKNFAMVSENLEHLSETFDVVLANIRTSVLISIAEPLMSKVKNQGTLVLSGILLEEKELIAEAFMSLGMPFVSQDGDWCALTWEKGSHLENKEEA